VQRHYGISKPASTEGSLETQDLELFDFLYTLQIIQSSLIYPVVFVSFWNGPKWAPWWIYVVPYFTLISVLTLFLAVPITSWTKVLLNWSVVRESSYSLWIQIYFFSAIANYIDFFTFVMW